MYEILPMVMFAILVLASLGFDHYLIHRETKYRDRYHPKNFFPLFDDVQDGESGDFIFCIHTIRLEEDGEITVHIAGKNRITYLHEGDKIVDVYNEKEHHHERFFLTRDCYPLLDPADMQEIHRFRLIWMRTMKLMICICAILLLFEIAEGIWDTNL